MNLCDCVKQVKKNKCYFYSLFFFSRCYEFLKKIHSDFQCCAQISFSRFRDQCHIVLNHFLKLPKKKRSCFLFFLFATLQYLCFKFKGTALRVCACACVCVVGVYTVQRTKQAILYKTSISNNQIGFLCSVAEAAAETPQR